MKTETEHKVFERKPASLASCIFYEYWWNDPEQRNYILKQCNNKKNTGGRSGIVSDDFHDERTYSCWHKNEGMKYRCWGESEEILKCPMAQCETEPEVACEKFVKEKVHPKKALVLKEEIRERFYEADGLCAICRNCFEEQK